MRSTVISLPQNATLRDVVDTFLKHHLDTLPIIDAAEHIAGFITIDDLTDLFLPRYRELLRDLSALEDKGQIASLFNMSTGLARSDDKLILAADVMKTKIVWIHQEDSLLEAAARLQNQRVQRLPVIDRDKKLVGLISNFEIVLALLQGGSASKKI